MESVYTFGIDVGTRAVKVIAMRDGQEVVGRIVADRFPDIEGQSANMLKKLADIVPTHISSILSTGEGRHGVKSANESRSSVLCQAVGIHELLPSVRTIVDAGAQYCTSELISDSGIVRKFVENERCASGTGKFAELIAERLEIPVGKWIDLINSNCMPAKIGNACAVFAETEIISLLAEGVSTRNIVAGICETIRSKICEVVWRLGKVQEDICITGGMAMNAAVTRGLDKQIGSNLVIPKWPQFTAALGAAYIAYRGQQRESLE